MVGSLRSFSKIAEIVSNVVSVNLQNILPISVP